MWFDKALLSEVEGLTTNGTWASTGSQLLATFP